MTTPIPEDNAPQWRSQLRAKRAAQAPATLSRGALLMRGRLFSWLAEYRERAQTAGALPANAIAAFWPMKDEPDLRPLLVQWAAHPDLAIALPVVQQQAAPLVFRRWTPDTLMSEGAYGISVPQDAEEITPDIVLVPTLGYTRRCDRIGYGGGYYDRTLAALRAANPNLVAIGIAWSAGELDDQYQPAAHDQRLDAILTEDGWLPSAPGTKAGPPTRTLFTGRI